MKRKNDWYRASDNELFGKRKTVKHRITKELELHGKHGFIWEFSSTHYKCCITSAAIANKNVPNCAKAKISDETLHIFPKAELEKWCKLLRISKNRNSMLEMANEY